MVRPDAGLGEGAELRILLDQGLNAGARGIAQFLECNLTDRLVGSITPGQGGADRAQRHDQRHHHNTHCWSPKIWNGSWDQDEAIPSPLVRQLTRGEGCRRAGKRGQREGECTASIAMGMSGLPGADLEGYDPLAAEHAHP
jgi:hypothetical protein